MRSLLPGPHPAFVWLGATIETIDDILAATATLAPDEADALRKDEPIGPVTDEDVSAAQAAFNAEVNQCHVYPRPMRAALAADRARRMP